MARLRKEEMTRRRAEEALARAQRERANEEARKRRAKSVKRTGGGFVVKFDQALLGFDQSAYAYIYIV